MLRMLLESRGKVRSRASSAFSSRSLMSEGVAEKAGLPPSPGCLGGSVLELALAPSLGLTRRRSAGGWKKSSSPCSSWPLGAAGGGSGWATSGIISAVFHHNDRVMHYPVDARAPGCSASGVEASEDRLVHPVGVLGGIVAAVCVLLPARRLVPFSPQLFSSVCRPSLVLVPPSISGKS